MGSGFRISKALATDIAKKLARSDSADIGLSCSVQKGTKHDIASIIYKGAVIGAFMIRRSKAVSHDLVARDMFISISQAVSYGRCTLSSADYIKILKEKGFLSSAKHDI